LVNKTKKITEFNVNDLVNASEVFDAEREANPIYRIYGKIEYLSLLNGLKNDYFNLEDFFVPQHSGNSKNILNSYRFYLVRPAESGHDPEAGYTQLTDTTKYIRYFKVVATPDNFELYPAGFNDNLYGEQTFGFNFNEDFDVSQYFDGFGFPITDLFLYAEYIEKSGESMSQLMWSSNGDTHKVIFHFKELNVGDFVKSNINFYVGDIIDYDKENFNQTQVSGQTLFIRTEYLEPEMGMDRLEWSYNPFISFKLRYLSEDLYTANTGSTSYDVLNSIPEYATKLDDDGNYVWRDISHQGYIESLSGIGVDYPFLNGRRYLFNSTVFAVVPNLSENETLKHQNTLDVFSEISYGKDTTNIDKLPLTELDNIGKPCS